MCTRCWSTKKALLTAVWVIQSEVRGFTHFTALMLHLEALGVPTRSWDLLRYVPKRLQKAEGVGLVGISFCGSSFRGAGLWAWNGHFCHFLRVHDLSVHRIKFRIDAPLQCLHTAGLEPVLCYFYRETFDTEILGCMRNGLSVVSTVFLGMCHMSNRMNLPNPFRGVFVIFYSKKDWCP